MTRSYVAVDLETTGLNPKYSRILEIGAVKVIDGQIKETYKTFVKPDMRIPFKIQELTGITNEMADNGKDGEKAVEELIDFCEDYPLLGHNLIFDYSFLKKYAVNQKLEFKKYGVDTLKIARKTLPDVKSRSLEYLCEFFEIEHQDKHRAYCDAQATVTLYELLQSRFGKQQPDIFCPFELIYQVKRQSPITPRQKVYLNDLIKYHKIDFEVDISSLTKSEASRYIDKFILNYGRIL
ncbi:3'-5' exonuclease [Anaerosacchariphilus polymeriproducens]|uniref:3'-5' exonuclease n=1 Tax=Anaerosacchariphilus polymeriproducens TaxID=1812858 RepID=A0A371AYK2_9FIRM|nr:3'-5' exonuclease [Anaerosacchariphilus polymeriproducens]RDU24572.1 3'-5' exonuclease [Anaerosacchariphilus polymeriproducens]